MAYEAPSQTASDPRRFTTPRADVRCRVEVAHGIWLARVRGSGGVAVPELGRLHGDGVQRGAARYYNRFFMRQPLCNIGQRREAALAEQGGVDDLGDDDVVLHIRSVARRLGAVQIHTAPIQAQHLGAHARHRWAPLDGVDARRAGPRRGHR